MRYLLITTLSLATFFAHAQWSWVHPLPQGNTLHDVQFVNATTGIAVGDCGTILKTTDGGNTWDPMESNTRESLNAVYFLDENNGFAISGGGEGLYKTTDGGQSWALLYNFDTFDMWDVWFTDPLHGTAAGDECVWVTSDGGLTWAWLSPYSWNYSIWFLSPSVAVMSSQSWLYKSYDGGNTWTIKQQDAHGWRGSLFFMNADTGFHVGQTGQIYRTVDGGEHWSLGPILTMKQLAASFILASGTGFIVGDAGVMLKTTDFGVSWFSLPALTDHNLETVTFSDSQNGIITGEQGIIMKTNDGGSTWTILTFSETKKRLNAVAFTDPNTGYITGDTATLLKTTDGGSNWQPLAIPAVSDLTALCFTDAQTGYVAGNGGMIYKTSNGGISWMPSQAGNRDHNAIEFPDTQTGYAMAKSNDVYDSVFLYRTTDAGNSWTKRFIDGVYLGKMAFTSPDTGYIGDYIGTIRKTTDGGATWNTLASYPGFNIQDLCFPTPSNGFACGPNMILKTTDAGLNWEPIYSGPLVFLRMFFTDPLNGYALSSYYTADYTLYKTENGGITWSQQPVTQICYQMRDMFFTGPSMGYLVGDKGAIFKTTNSGGIITSVNREQGTVNREEGVRIFPNPVRDRITVRLPESSQTVAVQVFSILGKEVASANCRNCRESGIDLPGLPAGTYIVRITTSASALTRKFIISQ